MNTIISEKLKTLRKNSGLTVNEIVNKLKKYNLDYSTQSIYKWEGGNIIPNIYILYAFANIYDCGIAYLVDNKPLHLDNVTLCEARALKCYRDNLLFKNISDLTLKMLSKTNC